jgi:hypothetical protein
MVSTEAGIAEADTRARAEAKKISMYFMLNKVERIEVVVTGRQSLGGYLSGRNALLIC